jgi:arylsulfatase A-like enzyme
MPKRLLCFLLLTTVACGTKARITDLNARLNLAQKQADTELLQFGTPQAEKHLSIGWSNPEKGEHGRLRWMTEDAASFSWEHATTASTMLHLRLNAPRSSPLELECNHREIWIQTIEPNESQYSIPLPSGVREVMLKKASGDRIGIYSAIITPSPKASPIPKTREYPLIGTLSVRNKSYPAWLSETGGTISFYQELSSSDAIEFGYYFASKTSDDSATFRILITPDGNSVKTVFENQMHSTGARFVHISMNEYVPAGHATPCKIQFQIMRDSAFGPATVAWLQPSIVGKPIKSNEEEPEIAKQMRDAARNSNIVFILLDAAAAKHFGCYGDRHGTTPVIDQLAKEGVLFQKAYTNAVYTLASTTTLFTGQIPAHHGILTHKNRLEPAAITLAETLRGSGFDTAAFLANGNASDIFGLMQGFTTVDDVFRKKDYVGWGQDLTDSFLGWLPRNNARRFFAYLHYREPHQPYNPPEQWIDSFVDPHYQGSIGRTFDSRISIDTNAQGLSDEDHRQILNLYEANLAYADFQVGRVLQALKNSGVYHNTIIVVSADHGEAFWEHGYQGHNRQLYEESARIPLIIKFPAGSGLSGKRIASVYQIADLYPSMIDLLNLPAPRARLDGESFLTTLTQPSTNPRIITIRSTRASTSAIVRGDYKLILSPQGMELYNLRKDPLERRNLIQDRPVIAGYLLQFLMEINESTGVKAKSESAVLDQETRENLRALGYLN